LANVEPSPGDVVYGGLWELDARGQADIDMREGYVEGREHNHYNRVLVPVDNGDELVQAFVYTMAHIDNRTSLPGLGYFELLVNGYKHFGLPIKALVDALEGADDPYDDRASLLAFVERRTEVQQYA
jgi:hypothetical protein